MLTLNCGQPCTSFTYQVPHLKSTNDYLLTTIPFNAYPNNAGTTINSIYIDDKYSPLIPMAFPFCFYGQTYNNMVVGSNSIVTFEALCASASNAYTLTVGGVPQTIPYNGGAGPTGIGTTYYPRTAIMAAYQDVDPSVSPIPPMRIEYNVYGTAPCRKLVISYKDVVMFQCNSLIHTSQIVLHESTGLIDIYLANKPTCTTWPSGAAAGLAILGIQDETRTKAVAAPGKNCTQWSESNTGYRFTPNGGTSKFINAQMFTMGGTLVATADTATTVPGLLDITFPNVCPPPGPTIQYVIKTTFSSCTGTPLISSDTITVDRVTTLAATVTTTPTTCGVSTGTITVTPTSGTGPYTYTINAGAPVTVPGPHTFTNLAAGTYTIVATDVTGCTNTFTVTVNTTTSITGTATTTNTSCPLSNDGTITVTPTSGTAPYSYSLDGGPGQLSNVFTNVAPGSHTVVFTDAFGCTGSVTVTITAGSTPLTANVSTTPTACPPATNGTITVTPTSGTAPYQYSLDGGPAQPGNVFNNVTAGAHSVTVTDVFGCTGTFPVNVGTNNTPLSANVVTTPTSCPTVNDGTIVVTPTSGTAPYQYSLDGGAFQLSNTFLNVTAGAHTVTIRDVFGCTGTIPVVVAQGASLTSTINGTNPPCSNINNGTILITPTSGSAPYQFSLNGGPNQPSGFFTGLAPGVYSITFTDNNGCTGTNGVTLTTNPPITATSTMNMPLCNGNANGSITLNAAGGVAPYQYSIDAGATYQPGATFSNLPAGTYNFLVKDALGCIYAFSFTLNEPPVLTAFATVNSTASCSNNDGSLTITAGGGTPAYQYSINNGLNYQASNIFTGIPVGSYNNILVKDLNGCTTSTSAVISLNDTMRLELGPDSTICAGSSIVLLPQTNPQTDTFKWRPATWLNYDTAKNPVCTPVDTIKYYLTAKWGLCSRIDSITINVLRKPVAFAGNDTTICYKTNALLHGLALNTSGPVTYAWTPPDSLNTPSAPITIARMDTTRMFTLTVTDNYGCSFTSSDSMWVIMQPVVPAFAGNDTIAMLNKPHQLMGSGGTNYMWSPAGVLNNPFIANPIAVLSNDTYFTVVVTDAIGCQAEDGVFVKVYEGPEYHVPNAFTPNGDGLNDIFRPIPSGMRSTDYFRVFNRFGQMVFQTNKWLEGWNGKFKGKDAAMGTYVWMIKGRDVNGKVIEVQGTVILLR
ncbi:MAG: gliding motility-associated C-terminal domain-containing protein [Chitinophagaceae bacterium]|nr:gliding motility-associated C-terminal domain-containing protein [Chitinophagaceae bacterium]